MLGFQHGDELFDSTRTVDALFFVSQVSGPFLLGLNGRCLIPTKTDPSIGADTGLQPFFDQRRESVDDLDPLRLPTSFFLQIREIPEGIASSFSRIPCGATLQN